MHHEYRYPPLQIIFPYAFLLVMPAFGAIAWFAVDMSGVGFVVGSIFWLFILALGGSVVTWMANNISARIQVNETGLSYKSLLGAKTILWVNVIDVQQRFLYERRGWHDNPQHANDLLVRAQDGSKINIFGIVRRCDDAGGIAELEAFIREKVGEGRLDFEQQKKRESIRQFRLCILAGSLCFVMGILMLRHPLSSRDVFGFLSDAIGFSADGLLLVAGGLALAIWATFRLRKTTSSKCRG